MAQLYRIPKTDSRKVYRIGLIVFGVWTMVAAGFALLLALGRGGHPPGIVVVPFVGLIWLIGGIALLMAFLAIAWTSKSDSEPRK